VLIYAAKLKIDVAVMVCYNHPEARLQA
jgi:hypothetical protein